MENHRTEAETIARLAAEAVAGSLLESTPAPILLTPETTKITSLEKLQPYPLRTQANTKLATQKDFVAYLKEHRICPAIFADRKALKLHAIMDYHSSTPQWLDHQATLVYERSQQLTTWVSKANQFMSQEAFAEFLDENLNDIQTPTPASVLDFVECLQCTRKETFRSAVKQTTGEMSFIWTKENQSQESTSILEEFTLGIPVWHRGEAIAIGARLYHRISEVEGKAKLTFKYRLEHLERIIDKLWDEQLEALRADLLEICPVYEGTAPQQPQPLM